MGRPASCDCGVCKRCKQKLYTREWYRRKSMADRRAWMGRKDPERRRANNTANRYRHAGEPEEMVKRRARMAAKNAVRDGRLIRRPCEDCGAEPAQGHHEDYSKPLEVRWLCVRCHSARHNPEAIPT